MENIVTVVLGVVFIVIGIFNRKGNISMLHSYHRKRVSEEDKLPFGKMVGIGTIIIGITLIAFGGLSYLSALLLKSIWLTVGYIVMVGGLVVGTGIMFFAMIKYNKGIF